MSQSGRRFETKSEYLSELRRCLEKGATLSRSEIEEIVQDTEEHFRHGLSKGKSESSIAVTLGEPRLLAEGYVAQNLVKVQPPKGASISSSSLVLFRAMKAIFIIAPVNFIFMFGPFLGLAAVVFAGWVVALAVGVASLYTMGLFFTAGGGVGAALSTWMSIAVICMGLGIFVSALFLALAMVKITEWILRAVWAWIRWNVNFLMST